MHIKNGVNCIRCTAGRMGMGTLMNSMEKWSGGQHSSKSGECVGTQGPPYASGSALPLTRGFSRIQPTNIVLLLFNTLLHLFLKGNMTNLFGCRKECN